MTNWTDNVPTRWSTEDEAQAQAAADELQHLIGQFHWCGTVKEIIACQISDKPASDPAHIVWVVRGTFETDGGDVEVWLTRGNF